MKSNWCHITNPFQCSGPIMAPIIASSPPITLSPLSPIQPRRRPCCSLHFSFLCFCCQCLCPCFTCSHIFLFITWILTVTVIIRHENSDTAFIWIVLVIFSNA